MTRRIMRTFKMDEISAVDRPAQAGARMTIMKRDDGEDYWKRDFTAQQRQDAAASGAALPDGSFPIKNRGDLENAIHAIGRAKDPAKAKAHIIARAKALGATSALPDGWVKKGIETMTDDEVKKTIDDAVKAATGTLTKQLADTTAALTTLQKAVKKKPPYDDSNTDGEPEPDADDDTKKAWRPHVASQVAKALAKQKEEFDAELAKRDAIAKGDETFESDGTVVRKSEVGETSFKIMKSQHDRLELQDFTKRAETEIQHLTGETIVKAKALRAVSKLDKESREAIEAMLKGGNAAMKANMGALGHNTPIASSAEGELEKLAKTYEAQHKVSYADAYSKVLETREGGELYAKAKLEKRAAA